MTQTSTAPSHHWFAEVANLATAPAQLSTARRYCAAASCRKTHLVEGERFYNPASKSLTPMFFCLACATRQEELGSPMTLDLSDEQVACQILADRHGVGIN